MGILMAKLIIEQKLQIFAVSIKYILYLAQKHSKVEIDWKSVFTQKYNNLLDVFITEYQNIFFSHHIYNLNIEVKKNKNMVMH